MNSEALVRYLATKIRLRRRVVGLTCEQLAHASGLGLDLVREIERGSTAASWADLAEIASALNSDVATLFEGVDDTPEAR